MSGIGPFRGEESIDFDALTRSGLFLIEGPTGAGKSTIIDAITYALYGSVAGGRESTTDRIRSDLADPTTPSYVELEFDVAGTTYLIRRQPAYTRPKLRGEGTVKENPKQLLRALDNSLEPLTDAREIGVAVQRLLGLGVEHFRKLVVLPQGEFDALLRASPADRFEVLGHLIDDGFMERVQDDLVARAREAQAQRDAAVEKVHDAAVTLCARAAEVLEDAPEPVGLTADMVEEVRGRLRLHESQARERCTSLAKPAQAAEAAATVAADAVARARDAAESLAALARARAALAADLQGAAADRLRGRRTEVAELLARLAPLEEWEAAARDREEVSAALAVAAQQAAARVEGLRERAEGLPVARAEEDRQRQEAQGIAAGLPRHLAEMARLEALLVTARQLDQATVAWTQATTAESAAEDALARAHSELVTRREQRVTLLERRLEHSAADLASRLVDGAPCPVCGSCEHPRIASPTTGGSVGATVSDADLEAAELAVTQAEQLEATASTKAQAARTALAEAQSVVDALRGRLAGVEVEALEGSLTAAREAAEAASEAESQAQAHQAALADLDREIAALDEQRQVALAEAAAAEARVAADAERRERERQALIAAVGPDTTAAQAAADARAQATALDAALDAFEQAAGHAPDADLPGLEAAAATAAAAARALRAELDSAQAVASRLAAACEAVDAHAARWSAAESAAATVMTATQTAISLGALVSAQSRSNTLRLTLQSYAVQRRFRTVLEAATVHLERMSGGHFAFELDESTGRGHSGLGIAVRDQWVGALRDPKALSGGETFIASLALALGLADVVREESGGVDLHTLFVDEGFGSLDPDSLQQVLDQLDALRSRGRIVGVISHVTEMKDWVHDRIVVLPGAPGSGSTLTQTT